MRRAALALVLASLSAAGCGGPPGYDHTEIAVQSEVPSGASLSGDAISLPEGSIVRAQITAYDTDGKIMELELSQIGGGLALYLAAGERDYVLVGSRQGSGSIRWTRGDEPIHEIPAVVTAPPP